MRQEDRKAAIAAYKERKTHGGIFLLRCAASGQAWVGQSRNLETVRNRIWFSLGMGKDPHRALQDAWKRHGADTFTLEVLETLPEEEEAYLVARRLRDRQTHWCEKLGAEVL
ncbi:GIY-YIG nuclease family protein [Zavarzinia compransoris]|uniref:GIY-YIG nuclease family protein n=1 Tax=Zavarzinia marina TaxID=2911065 RepID=UPI001F264570|nr:GIY-YIG nuclease family protein [Zavarzinia marina]MCF4166916.1 GIY-YIG nuclease family protein [Zavarzinia marina]